MVGLFSIVAILPAILVAIVASITLDVGLDRWFSIRTKSIVNSSLSVAQAYVLENARFLQGQTVSMANDLDNARSLYSLDRVGFTQFMTRQATGRGLLGAFLVRQDGSVIVQADIETERPLPAVPEQALRDAVKGAADADSTRRDQSGRRLDAAAADQRCIALHRARGRSRGDAVDAADGRGNAGVSDPGGQNIAAARLRHSLPGFCPYRAAVGNLDRDRSG